MRNFFSSGVVAAIALLSAGTSSAAEVGIGWSALQDPQLATLIETALKMPGAKRPHQPVGLQVKNRHFAFIADLQLALSLRRRQEFVE
jgi:hypothetical protein